MTEYNVTSDVICCILKYSLVSEHVLSCSSNFTLFFFTNISWKSFLLPSYEKCLCLSLWIILHEQSWSDRESCVFMIRLSYDGLKSSIFFVRFFSLCVLGFKMMKCTQFCSTTMFTLKCYLYVLATIKWAGPWLTARQSAVTNRML